MDQSEPILILAKNWNQFSVGVAWLYDNCHNTTHRPIYIDNPHKLQGMRGTKLFIMDGALTGEYDLFLHCSNFASRNKIFDMIDTIDPKELTFEITERLQPNDSHYPLKNL